MPQNLARKRYSNLSIGLHWLMVLQLIGVYACINLSGIFPHSSGPREALKTWHFMLGLSVLAAVILRILIRWFTGAPEALSGTPHWQHRLAGLTHIALYAMLLAAPILGWLTLSSAGKPISFFGLSLPVLVGPDKLLSHRLEDVHTTIGTIGYYLIGLHVLATFYHHYVLKDGTLRRILPARAP